MASFLGKPSQRYYGILTFSASFLFLLRRIVFLSPFSLLDMQPIQHRPPATNAPGLFRHIINAAIVQIDVHRVDVVLTGGRDMDNLTAQRFHQRIILSFGVCDDNIVRCGKEFLLRYGSQVSIQYRLMGCTR